MKRRQLIGSIVGVGAALAGCIGDSGDEVRDSDNDGVVDSADYAPRDPDVQEKGDTGQSSGGGGSGEGSGSSSSSRAARQSVLDTYNRGVRKANEGISAGNSAISAYNNGNYQSALSSARRAKGRFREAKEIHSDALNGALQLNNQEAVNICRDAVRHDELLRQSSAATEDAAEAAMNNQIDIANTYAQESRSLQREAQSIGVRNPSTLKSVLGL